MKRQRREAVSTEEESLEILNKKKPLIIVPMSDVPAARVALPIAKAIAKITGAKVHILHVTGAPISSEELLQRLGLKPAEVHGMLLEQACGPVGQTIAKIAAEREASLIAMATFGKRKPLSPVAETVLKLAPCPVIFVRPESRRLGEEIDKILLPLDGTPTTAAAIGPAIELAARSRARLDALYVVAPGAPAPEEPGTLTVPRYVDQPQHEWPAWAREFLDRFCAVRTDKECPVMPAHLYLRRGEPAGEILRFAEENESDLIVLVWRGHFRGKRATTIKAVLRDAPCPVLVLHTKTV